MSDTLSLEELIELPDFSKNNGLISAIVQDYTSKDILMSAFMNKEAWAETLYTKKACYYSRSRNALWRKGETSGHVQHIKDIRIDCDNDCVLLFVEQIGAACHTNHISCFYRQVEEENSFFKLTKCSQIIDA